MYVTMYIYACICIFIEVDQLPILAWSMSAWRAQWRDAGGTFLWRDARSHLQTLAIYKLGFIQDYYTFTLI